MNATPARQFGSSEESVSQLVSSEELKNLFEKQTQNRWAVSKTTAEERIAKLEKIRNAVLNCRDEIHRAIFDDFKKNPAESDLTEIFPIIAEVNHTIKHLRSWMKPQGVKTPFVLLGTSSKIHYEAKGVVLILSPWNYPFQLLMSPLIAALSAGNCVIVKPSSKVPHTARFAKKFLGALFPEEEVAVVEGGPEVADQLLEFPFDHIFFTGSTPVGKKIMTAAAKHLTPVTLELGGKSPVIVDETADIKKAAQRIAWAKFVNAGQTCVAPDYLLLHKDQLPPFIDEFKKVVGKRYGKEITDQEKNENYCRLVSEGAGKTLQKILNAAVDAGAQVEMGGETTGDNRFFPPTLLTGVKDDSPIMKEEIFGPILPVLTWQKLDDAYAIIRKRPKPLALYIFSKNNERVKQILKETTAGGSCVNNLVIHLANSNLPFGGVGFSGMGNYHGFFGFKTFSHERAVLSQGVFDSLKTFYPPYTRFLRKLISWMIRHVA